MDGKKISFGFSKVTKKPALQLNKNSQKDESKKIELIKCLEGQEIKLIEEKKEAAALVIPLKDGGKTSAALASLAKRRAVLLGEDEVPQEKNVEQEKSEQTTNEIGEETIEQRAAREILAELKASNEDDKNQANLVLPVVSADELPLDGAKESSLDDYESIPIEKYGWAMLRGMGAVEPTKSTQKESIDSGPTQRPPGLGLGADKALKPKPLLEQPEANEKLEIKKHAYVRILAGKFKDAYGQIEGFDHERGTIVVKLAIGSAKQKFQEFLCQPVSKKEYAQYGKCINKAKYEEYKKLENEHGQVVLKKEGDVKLKNEKMDFEPYRSNQKRSNSRSRSSSRSKKYSSKRRSRSRSNARYKQHRTSRSPSLSADRKFNTKYRSRSKSPARNKQRSFRSHSSTPPKKYNATHRSSSKSPARHKQQHLRARSRSNSPKSKTHNSNSRLRSKSRSVSHSPTRSKKSNYELSDSYKYASISGDTKSKSSHKKKHKHKHSSNSQSDSDDSDNARRSRHHKREKKKKSKKKSKKDSRR